MYDSFNIPGTSEFVQLKVGPCVYNKYHICDKVPLATGVYVSDNGAIVIVNKTYTAYLPHLIDKWGGILDTGEIIKGRNPLTQALKEEDLIPTKDRIIGECIVEKCIVEEWKHLFEQYKEAGFSDGQAFELLKAHISNASKQ